MRKENSREFLEEMIMETKKYVPEWLYASLVKAARARAGGKAKANRMRNLKGCAEEDRFKKAKWTTAFINDLPDSSFLYVQPDGEKDEEGKTVPRTYRHLPVRDQNGKLDLPHLRNALARLDSVEAPGIDRDKVREKAEQWLERVKENKTSKALISFVVSELSPIEKARGEALVGDTGVLFQELYLDPLGIDREDVHITVNKEDVLETNPNIVIALGRIAKQNLGDWADFSLPHPEAIKRHGDSGEVGRKLRSIHKVLFDKIENQRYFKDSIQRAKIEPIVEYKADNTSIESKISKAAPVKRIVYGVVSDPYGASGAEEDAHNEWISPAEVEKMAHDYLKESRVVGLQHKKKAQAQVVESSIEQYPSKEDYLKALNGEPHRVTRRNLGDDRVHSGSWIMGVELQEPEWKLFEKGEITGFSIGGYGTKIPISKSKMPNVTFVDLVEGTTDA